MSSVERAPIEPSAGDLGERGTTPPEGVAVGVGPSATVLVGGTEVGVTAEGLEEPVTGVTVGVGVVVGVNETPEGVAVGSAGARVVVKPELSKVDVTDSLGLPFPAASAGVS